MTPDILKTVPKKEVANAALKEAVDTAKSHAYSILAVTGADMRAAQIVDDLRTIATDPAAMARVLEEGK